MSPVLHVMSTILLQGVPVRVEVGPKDVASASCVVSRRDRPGKEGKQFGVSSEPAAFVQHVTSLNPDAHGVRLGCEMVNASGAALRSLQRYIDQTQKRRKFLTMG